MNKEMDWEKYYEYKNKYDSEWVKKRTELDLQMRQQDLAQLIEHKIAATKKQNEALVKDAVKIVLNQLDNCWHCMPATGGYGSSGTPDFIGCYNGMMFGIETKSGDAVPTALQNRELLRIEEAGGYSLVVNEANVDGLELLMKMALLARTKHEETKREQAE